MRTNLFLASIPVAAEAIHRRYSLRGSLGPPLELISFITEAKLSFNLDKVLGKRSCFLTALESRNWCWILLMWKIKGRFLLSFVHQVSQSTGQEIVTVNTSQTSTNFQLKFWIILKFKYDFTYLPFYADIIRIFILTARVVSVITSIHSLYV